MNHACGLENRAHSADCEALDWADCDRALPAEPPPGQAGQPRAVLLQLIKELGVDFLGGLRYPLQPADCERRDWACGDGALPPESPPGQAGLGALGAVLLWLEGDLAVVLLPAERHFCAFHHRSGCCGKPFSLTFLRLPLV